MRLCLRITVFDIEVNTLETYSFNCTCSKYEQKSYSWELELFDATTWEIINDSEHHSESS